jgi:hypothetical protein
MRVHQTTTAYVIAKYVRDLGLWNLGDYFADEADYF